MVKIVAKLPLTVNFPVKTKKKVLQPTFFFRFKVEFGQFLRLTTKPFCRRTASG